MGARGPALAPHPPTAILRAGVTSHLGKLPLFGGGVGMRPWRSLPRYTALALVAARPGGGQVGLYPEAGASGYGPSPFPSSPVGCVGCLGKSG